MSPPVDPFRSDEALPVETGVVIIGGGIVGTSTALWLARKGVPVLLCEKGVIGGEQSSRNWGWCRKMGRDPRELPLIIESMRQWGDMNTMIGGETGFRRIGITYLAETAAELAHYETWLEHSQAYQLDTRLLSAAETAALFPNSGKAWAGALHTASDGRAEPQMAAPAVAEGARRAGAVVMTGCAVRGIETSGGRISGVVTEKGRVRCQSVVLAGGAWSRLFCGNLDLRLPQLKVLSSVMRTKPLEGGPEGSAAGPGFGFRKRLDGGYNVSERSSSISEITPDSFRFFRDFLPAYTDQWKSMRLRVGRRTVEEMRWKRHWSLDETTEFEKQRVLDPEPDNRTLDKAKASLAGAFPVFAGMQIAQRWAGMIDVTPDAVPVISPVETIPGFFISTGYSGHGFGIGPAAGRLTADLVTGDTPIVDPTPFRFSRFFDGTKHKVMML